MKLTRKFLNLFMILLLLGSLIELVKVSNNQLMLKSIDSDPVTPFEWDGLEVVYTGPLWLSDRL